MTRTYDEIRRRYDRLLEGQDQRHRERMNALCDLLDSWPLARRTGAVAVAELLRREERRAQARLMARKYRHLDMIGLAAAMRLGVISIVA